MPYAFVQDVPIDESMYQAVREEMGPEPPAGLITHVALKRPEGGLRYLNVWESQSDWDAFYDARLRPAIDKVLADRGTTLPAPRAPQTGEVISVWQGA